MENYGRDGHKSKHHHHRERHHRHHHHRHRRDSSDHSQNAEERVPPPPQHHQAPPGPPVKEKNFKLIVDPILVKGAKKVYRYDGVVPGEPAFNVLCLKDPRPIIPRRWTRQEIIELPVPKFKIDSNYVGEPPEVEIIITNLNDNIDRQFLTDMVIKFGDVEEVTIFYHPVTRKHCGFARVVFSEVASAANCVASLHSKSVMGKQLVVINDPFGKEWLKKIESLTAPKKELLAADMISDEEREEDFGNSKDDEVDSKVCKDVKVSEVTDDYEIPKTTAQDEGNASPFSNKTLICNPSPAAVQVPSYPPPQITSTVQLPDLNRPPPAIVGRGAWPIQNNMQWQHPPPSWSTPSRFMSPPLSMPPLAAPVNTAAPDKGGSLDLDTRIELLLKGGMNGMAPPFLALDIPEEEAVEKIEEKPVSRASSVCSEEPLPPGVDISPSLSPVAPLPVLTEYSSDKYLPLSTPPSPFLSEEEYLECLLNWRLKHLSYVQDREREIEKRRKLLEADKVSEISSEEDEAVFGKTAKEDDRMSLSSLSSTNDVIQEVAIPSNPYGSYTYGETVPSYPTIPGIPYGTPVWRHPPGQIYPCYNPALPPPIHYPPPTIEEPVDETSVFKTTVDMALERVCELLTATLEKDLMKRMTEVLAFNEFEKWWEEEERRFKEKTAEPSKAKPVTKDDREEKSTSDLLSAIDDGMAVFGLGFRAAMPKMPSFRRKPRLPSPKRNIGANKQEKDRRNESDEEEMVQLSDSESQHHDSDMVMKKRLQSESSSSSSESDSSMSISDESDGESSETESQEDVTKATDLFTLIDFDKVEEMRSKTPDGRLTPVGDLDFSGNESEEDHSRASSPAHSKYLKKTAMEALMALGLDEFVADVKIRNDVPPPSRPTRSKGRPDREVPSTSKVKEKPVKAEKPQPLKSPSPKQPVIKSKPAPQPETPVQEEKKKPKAVAKREERDSEDTLSPQEDLISVEHSYSKPKPIISPKTEKVAPRPALASWELDHDYSGPRPQKVEEKVKETKEEKRKEKIKVKEEVSVRERENASVKSTAKERKRKSEKLVSHLIDSYLKKPSKEKVYPARDQLNEMLTCYEFLTKGIDMEDTKYLKRAFEGLLNDPNQSSWLNDMHWASHPFTDIGTVSSRHHRGNPSGCARTEGYYKMDPVTKQQMKYHHGRNTQQSELLEATAVAKGYTAANREARNYQRRLLTAFGADTDSDLLKFNNLKFRKKLLKFGKSEIHDWGLFAREPIAADEMVIEYVGQKVRPFLADYREIKYQKRGIGSSYLFKIGPEHIVDATHCGNLSRFINHSCNPNCYAKIITIEGEKKIVIYSRRDIKVDEEITYDYKFPLEEEKIVCLCGDAQCKGFLN